MGALKAQPDTWVTQFGTELQDTPEDLIVDDAGNSYVSGFFRDTMTIGGITLESAGLTDVFLAKFDPAGQVLWAKRFGWNANEFAHGLAFDLQGNVLMVGEYQDSTIFDGDTLFSGDSLWFGAPAQTYDVFWVRVTPAGVMDGIWAGGWFGGEGWSEVEVGLDSLYYFAGFYRTYNNWTFANQFDSLGHGFGYDDAIWVRSNASGVMDHKAIGKGHYVDKSTALALVGDSLVVMAGTFEDTCWFEVPGTYTITDFEEDIWIACYNDTGAFRWVVAGGSKGVDDLTALVTNAAGEIYFGGQFDSVFTMGASSLAGSLYLDGIVGKLSPTGSVLWLKRFGGPGYDGVRDIRLLANGNLLVTGYYQGSMDLGTQTLTLSDVYNQNSYVALLDPAGNLVWVRDLGGSDIDLGVAVDEDASGYIYALGTFSGTGQFGQASATSMGSEDIYLLRMNSDGAVYAEAPQEGPIAAVQAWPNPTDGRLHLSVDLRAAGDVELQILDLQGRVQVMQAVGRQPMGIHKMEVDLGALAPGIYLYRVQAGAASMTGKVSVLR